MIIFDKTFTIMTKKILYFIFLNLFAFSFSQNVNIPDAYFKALLISIKISDQYAKDLNGNYIKVDANGDGEIQNSEAENISYLSTAYENNLTDIIGIEAFKNLTELNIEQTTKLKSLQLSSNTKLKKIKGLYNQSLEEININNCLSLEDIDLFSTKINSIDVSQNLKLKNLVITGNYASLNLSKNTQLEQIRIGSDNLASLNLDNCNKLSQIRIDNDNLSAFNFSQLAGLQNIVFATTKMSSINFSSSPVTDISFWYDASNLSSILLPIQNSNLKSLSIPHSKISSLDLSKSLNLEYFNLSSNIISSLDLSRNIGLKQFTVSDSNSITKLDVSNNINLEMFNVFRLPNLSNISVKNGKQQTFGEGFLECPKLTYVCCDDSEKAYFQAKNIQTVVTDCLLAVQENKSLSDFKIYPNPTTDLLNFSQKIESIKILDTQGRLILNKKINANTFDVSNLRSGVYILEVSSDSNKTNLKFTKK